ncbi:hypothetical protein ENBRE01_1670 [Enteropsectra breve]|nr:hypothetical protein ENBRE01_1670 [Enteropsectra breve]
MKISFKGHSIPNTKMCLWLNDRCYFVYKDYLYVLRIDENRTYSLFPCKSTTGMCVFTTGSKHSEKKLSRVAIVNDSTLNIYRQTENSLAQTHSLPLESVPNMIKAFSQGLIFIYGSSVQIFSEETLRTPININNSAISRHIQNMSENSQTIKDITCSGNYSYILTGANKIVRILNIFDTLSLISPVAMQCTNKSTAEHKSIAEHKSTAEHKSIDSINETDKEYIILGNDSGFEKHEIVGERLGLKYSYSASLKECEQVAFQCGYWCDKNLVEIGKAPMLVLSERINSLFKMNITASDSKIVALSDSRIYFIEKEEKEIKSTSEAHKTFNAVECSMVEEVTVPDYIENSEIEEEYVNLLQNIERCSMLADEVLEKQASFKERERFISDKREEINRGISAANDRAAEINKRIEKLKNRAMLIVKEGDKQEFSDGVKYLESLICKIEKENVPKWEDIKSRLLVQRSVLKAKRAYL